MKSKIYLTAVLLTFFMLSLTSCITYGSDAEREEWPDANFVFADCSEFKQMLDERDAMGMASFSSRGEQDEITEDRGWKYIDQSNRGFTLYHLTANRSFGSGILNVTAWVQQINENGELSHKVYFSWGGQWLEGGVVDVFIDYDTNIMVIENPLWNDMYLFGYLDDNPEGFLMK